MCVRTPPNIAIYIRPHRPSQRLKSNPRPINNPAYFRWAGCPLPQTKKKVKGWLKQWYNTHEPKSPNKGINMNLYILQWSLVINGGNHRKNIYVIWNKGLPRTNSLKKDTVTLKLCYIACFTCQYVICSLLPLEHFHLPFLLLCFFTQLCQFHGGTQMWTSTCVLLQCVVHALAGRKTVYVDIHDNQ